MDTSGTTDEILRLRGVVDLLNADADKVRRAVVAADALAEAVRRHRSDEGCLAAKYAAVGEALVRYDAARKGE